VVLERPIKTLGMHPVRVVLHPEVAITVTANVAQSVEEAEMQAKGIDPLRLREEEDEEAQREVAAARAIGEQE
jgi:large subunit ribosomal protein L9